MSALVLFCVTLCFDNDESPSGGVLTAVTCLTNACMHCRDPSILSSITICFTKPVLGSLLHDQVLHTCIQTHVHLHTQNTCWTYRQIHAISHFVSTPRCGALIYIKYMVCTGHPWRYGLLKEYVLHVLHKSVNLYKTNQPGEPWEHVCTCLDFVDFLRKKKEKRLS